MSRVPAYNFAAAMIAVLGPASTSICDEATGPPYAKDLAAFFEEVDRTYPFFEVKDIRVIRRK